MTRRSTVAIVCGLVAFGAYAASMPPSYAFWDTGELQTVATILGIAHPPACPAFVLLGWIFAHALPFGEAAWRVSVMCAFAVAIAVGLLYATARRLGISPAAALLGTIGFAFASVVWKNATRAEVQDLALVFRVLALFCALAYARAGRTRDLFATGFALGLAGATHGISVLMLPPVALVLAVRRTTFRVREFAVVGVGLVLGLLPYAYLPLRSAWLYAHAIDPTLSLGLPPGGAFWDYDHPSTLHNFIRVVSGADFDVGSGFAGFVDVSRYPRYVAALVTRSGTAFGIACAVLGMVGVAKFVLSRDLERIAVVVAAVSIVPYTESYSALQDPDRYYLIALWCAAIVIGAGFDTLASSMQFERPSVGRFVLAAGVVASLVAAAPDRLDFFKQRDDYGARAYAHTVMRLVPDGSIVIADWAYSTPLAYASYVERSFGNRIVIAASAAQFSAYYPRWLDSRGVYVVSFDDALALPGFRVRPMLHDSFHIYRIDRSVRRS